MTTRRTTGSASEKAVRDHLRHLGLEAKSDRTIYERGLLLGRVQKALPVPLLEATPEMLYDWRAGLKVCNNTIANYVSHCQMFYRWAAKQGLIAADPSPDIPVPSTPKRVPRPISQSDLMALLDATDKQAARIRIWLGRAVGWGRRGKKLRLPGVKNTRVSDDPPVLIVASDATKGRTERYIALSPFVIAEIRAAALPSSGLAFPRPDGSPLRQWDVARIMNNFLHSHGIADQFHSLRHPFGSQAEP